jgi:hypothetical protein
MMCAYRGRRRRCACPPDWPLPPSGVRSGLPRSDRRSRRLRPGGVDGRPTERRELVRSGRVGVRGVAGGTTDGQPRQAGPRRARDAPWRRRLAAPRGDARRRGCRARFGCMRTICAHQGGWGAMRSRRPGVPPATVGGAVVPGLDRMRTICAYRGRWGRSASAPDRARPGGGAVGGAVMPGLGRMRTICAYARWGARCAALPPARSPPALPRPPPALAGPAPAPAGPTPAPAGPAPVPAGPRRSCPGPRRPYPGPAPVPAGPTPVPAGPTPVPAGPRRPGPHPRAVKPAPSGCAGHSPPGAPRRHAAAAVVGTLWAMTRNGTTARPRAWSAVVRCA